jgi:U3 small nucleolar RNA-associated protein 12
MVKSYNKYEAEQSFGLVNSPASNVLSIQNGSSRSSGAGHAIVGANEEVFRWDLKKGELLSRWRDSTCTAQVTVIACSGVDSDLYAVGLVQKYLSCPLHIRILLITYEIATKTARYEYGTRV